MIGVFTTSDGAAITYYVDGPQDAPVLLLAHSLGTDSSLWELQMPSLVETRCVVRYDARGHGRSSSPPGDYSIPRLAMDALELLDALRAETVVFAGISLGGMVGQWLGARAPDRIRSLALANTSAYMGPPDAWNGRIATIRSHGMIGVADAVVTRWFTPAFLSERSAVIPFARSMLLKTSPVGYAGSCAAIRDADLRSLGRLITAPTLIIAGAYDLATPPSQAEALRAEITNARLTSLPGAHLSNLEQPSAFASALNELLQDPSPDAPMRSRVTGARCSNC